MPIRPDRGGDRPTGQARSCRPHQRFGGVDDSQIYVVRADWAATDALKLSAELRHETSGETTVGTLGAKYDVRENLFIHGEYKAGQTIGFLDGDSAFFGVGFRF